MLWVEAGVGVCILDSRNVMVDNPAVKFLDVDIISDPSLSIAWHKDHYNPVKEIFMKKFLERA